MRCVIAADLTESFRLSPIVAMGSAPAMNSGVTRHPPPIYVLRDDHQRDPHCEVEHCNQQFETSPIVLDCSERSDFVDAHDSRLEFDSQITKSEDSDSNKRVLKIVARVRHLAC